MKEKKQTQRPTTEALLAYSEVIVSYIVEAYSTQSFLILWQVDG